MRNKLLYLITQPGVGLRAFILALILLPLYGLLSTLGFIPPLPSLISPQPDLAIMSFTKEPYTANPGEDIGSQIKLTIKNQGGREAREVVIDLYFSTDDKLDLLGQDDLLTLVSDYALRNDRDKLLEGGRVEVAVPVIAPNQVVTVPLSGVKLPPTWAIDHPYIWVRVDPFDSIPEPNEQNNVACFIIAPNRDPLSPCTLIPLTPSPTEELMPTEEPSLPTEEPLPTKEPPPEETRPLITIAGLVWEDRNGNTFPDLGEAGLPDITITITDNFDYNQTLTTDAQGYYAARVNPGPITIDVNPPTNLASCSRLTTDNDPTKVIVLPDSSGRVDFGFHTTANVTGLVWEDRNGNRQFEPAEENGLSGIAVVITDTLEGVQTTLTNVEGIYATEVAPGNVTLTVSSLPGYPLTTGNVPSTVFISACDSGEVNFGFQSIGQVTGLVWQDDNANAIREPDERGLPNIAITITDSLGLSQTAVTNMNGIYSATVIAGTITLAVVENEANLPTGSRLTTNSNPTTMTILAGSIGGADFGFQPSSTVTGLLWEDRSEYGLNSNGLPGVLVSITDSEGKIQNLTTDGTGGYNATIPPGMATIEIKPPSEFVLIRGNNPALVTIPAGGIGGADFVVRRPSGLVTGLVSLSSFDCRSDISGSTAGLSGIGVLITHNLGNTLVQTGSDGRYRATVPVGSAVIKVNLPPGYVVGAGNDSTSVTVSASSSSSANFCLQAQGTVTGLVWEDRDGNSLREPAEPPLSGVPIAITSSTGITERTFTDSGGQHTMLVNAGLVTLTIEPPDYYRLTTANSSTTVNIPADGYGQAEFGLRPEGMFTGRICEDSNNDTQCDLDKSGLPNINVVVTDSVGAIQVFTTTAAGYYTATAVLAGEVSIGVDESDPDLPLGSRRTTPPTNPFILTLQAGPSDDTIDFGFRPEGRVAGLVCEDSNNNGECDSAEIGLSNVTIVVTDSLGTTIPLTTTVAGLYSTQVLSGQVTIGLDESDSDLPSCSVSTSNNNPTSVLVRGEDSVIVDFSFHPEVTLAGQVWEDLNGNSIFDSDEQGLGGILVTVTNSFGYSLERVTDVSGFYEVQLPLRQGPPSVSQALTGDTSDFYIEAIALLDLVTITVAVPPAYSVTNTNNPTQVIIPPSCFQEQLDFGLQPDPSIVTGLIWQDFDGDAIPDPSKSFSNFSLEPGLPNVPVIISYRGGGTQTVTDAIGYYTATVTAGDITIEVIPPADSRLTTPTNNPMTVPISPGETRVINFGFQPLPATITGLIWGDFNSNGVLDSGEPRLPDVTVRITDSLGNTQTPVTDANGIYTAIVTPGQVTITVIQPPTMILTTNNNPATITIPAGGSGGANFGFVPSLG